MVLYNKFLKGLKKSLFGFLVKTTKEGHNLLSAKLRPFFEHTRSRLFVVVPLTGLTFFTAIGIPELSGYISKAQTEQVTIYTVIEVSTSDTSYQWPLQRFGISQNYSHLHPGLDMTAPAGTPIKPVREGVVASIEISPDGYGQHIVVTHENGTKSLYAHLSKIEVTQNEKVSKETELGHVGSTGHSTGNHLHLEVLEKDHALNPFEVLPEVKKENLTDSVIPVASPSGQLPEILRP